jgi:hypothetical protein
MVIYDHYLARRSGFGGTKCSETGHRVKHAARPGLGCGIKEDRYYSRLERKRRINGDSGIIILVDEGFSAASSTTTTATPLSSSGTEHWRFEERHQIGLSEFGASTASRQGGSSEAFERISRAYRSLLATNNETHNIVGTSSKHLKSTAHWVLNCDS